MIELNINDLPREILTNIFGFLDAVHLKNATLTCKLWNHLTESTCRWSLQLPYDGKLNEPHTEQKMNFISTTNRKFGKIRILNGHFCEDSQILKMLQKHGFNVVELFLCECRIESLIAFAELMNLTANLKYIFLAGVSILSDATDYLPLDQVLPNLKKLKRLEMRGSDLPIIKCFQKAKLTRMDFWGAEPSEYQGPWVDFLSSQEMLTSLTTYTCGMPQMGNVPIPFRLTKLTISFRHGKTSSHDHHNLLRLVKSQAGSVTEMEIGSGIPSSVYECVFASFTKLNTLLVLTSKIPQDNDFYKRLKQNCSVRTIEIRDYTGNTMDHIQFLVNFLKKLPNICSLILPMGGIKSTLAVAQNLTKLESLSLGFIDEPIDCLKFPSLKTLHIRILRAKINWNEFTKIHPRLVELTICVMDDKSFLTSNDFDQITSNVDLQSIRLGVGFVADNRFFEIVRSKCRNLKMLNLHKSCVITWAKTQLGN